MGKSIFSPVLTSHKQIDDVFSSSTLPYAMWRNLTLGNYICMYNYYMYILHKAYICN